LRPGISTAKKDSAAIERKQEKVRARQAYVQHGRMLSNIVAAISGNR
jgi:hypothetical protein